MDDPNDILHDAVIDTVNELEDETPFICTLCSGEEFDCIDDVVFHILMDHDFVMVKTDTGTLITYQEFMSRVADNMMSTISHGDESNDKAI